VIESSQSLNATYHWVTPSGSTAPATIALTAGKGRTVTTTFMPGSNPFSGTATLQITSPANVSQSVPIEVTCTFPPISITAPSLDVAEGQTPGSFTATGGSGIGYTWSESGTLSKGLSLLSSGQFSGTATQQGTFPFTVMVTDSAGDTQSADLTLTVGPPLIP